MAEIVPDLVSVIIPVYNRAAMLQAAVDSVLAQTWRRFEILICDDGSSDDTTQLGPALERAHPGVVRYQWNPNAGAGVARESGRQRARGEFIQYLDSDDSLWPRKFEVQIAALRANPRCGAAYGWIRLCPEGGSPRDLPHKWSGRELRTLFPALLVDRWWNTNAPLWRRSLCDAIGPWSDLRYSQDWEYDARAGALGVELAYCPEFVTDQRHHEGNRQTGSGRWLAPTDRVRFFSALFSHARSAGVALDTPEMKHFARWVFRQARECALLGDDRAAATLCTLTERAQGRDSLELRSYRSLAAVFGWARAARWSEQARRWAGRGAGADTQKQSWMT
jgi:glycosyltransferase involved in cell wall biosynthesis